MVCGLLGHGLLTLGARSVLSRQTMPIHNGLQNLESAIKWARSAHRNQTMPKNTTDLDLFHLGYLRCRTCRSTTEYGGENNTSLEEGDNLPEACPPPDTGRGRGPTDTSSREAGTQETLGGAGVKRSETESSGRLSPFPLPQTKEQFLSLGFLPIIKTTAVY
jgi:hypothetical protein